MRGALALALTMMLPALAFGQEGKKFNVKDLEKQFDPLPVFSVKGQAVDNEVIVSEEPERDLLQADYVVRAEVKKVIEFYKGKLRLEPKKEGEDELGTAKYVFAPKPMKGDKRLFRVILQQAEGNPTNTVIRLLRRKVTDDDPVVGD